MTSVDLVALFVHAWSRLVKNKIRFRWRLPLATVPHPPPFTTTTTDFDTKLTIADVIDEGTYKRQQNGVQYSRELHRILRSANLINEHLPQPHLASTQTRRLTRATRPNANENINARPSRIITRTKAMAATIAGIGTSTSTKAGGAVDAGAQGKRKREALHEVTIKAVNRNKSKQTEGKGKEKDEGPEKPAKASTSTAVVTRQPLRTTATRQKGPIAAGHKSVPMPAGDNDMVVDPPHLPPPVVLVSTSTFRTAATTRRTTARASVVAESRPTTRKGSNLRQPAVFSKEPEVEVVEEEPAYKKRRTSSEIGDELEVVDETNEDDLDAVQIIEDDDQGWDDLDREDDDDPLMVSEYVADIFNYLKEVEVSYASFVLIAYTYTFCHSKPQCLTPTTWKTRKSSLGKCAVSSWTG